ncbi:specific RNA polymerase II transcription factor [Pyrrhoderma noxium]|uniref:Specific RNA polymerase II transcription factor n=1 Tax=Pyrrhoderma noxium TaxID=2282107 RepID=A0A286U6E4_9AGAM|nr:specific RNA polymerase II transcription factor [Pyrrhoderma noxium]
MTASSPDSNAEPSGGNEQQRRRAYKACLHCRSRKAKCDLGDIDAPGQPPCARCKRERRECVFAPSFRGGKVSKKTRAESGDNDKTSEQSSQKRESNPVNFSTSDLDLEADLDQDIRTISDSEGPPRKTRRTNSSGSRSGSENNGEDVDPQSLARTSLRNPTDALNLLALAADVNRKSNSKRRDSRGEAKPSASAGAESSSSSSPIHATENNITNDGISENHHQAQSDETSRSGHSKDISSTHNHQQTRTSTTSSLSNYALVRERVLSATTLSDLVRLYFARAHAIFPMFSYNRIPRTSSELAQFATEETPLLTAIVVIVSRQEKLFEIHSKSWEYMSKLMYEMILGKHTTTGAMEALLLLSENLPRRPEPVSEDEEHRMSWMLVGMAVRMGYMLGHDQKTLRPYALKSEESSNRNNDKKNEHERIDRDRLSWTYCYMFDRSISIRSGKAFWSRGPGLCFQPTYSGAMPSASETFPTMRAIEGKQDDYSAMLQAYTELTQTMASAHDILYPSKDRTIALARVGDYHKYLDDLTRSKDDWEGKQWTNSLVSQCVWLTFHYTRLYIYVFAFQSHVQRNTSTSHDGKKVADNAIFPRGPMASPDSRFILEAIDAATQLLSMCVEQLQPSGAMSYLPWRFFLYIQYAGVFLLKAVFVGAVLPQDARPIIHLVKKVIVFLACASPDDQHAGVRYARLLNGLLRVFSRGLDGVTSQVGTPKRRATQTEFPPNSPPRSPLSRQVGPPPDSGFSESAESSGLLLPPGEASSSSSSRSVFTTAHSLTSSHLVNPSVPNHKYDRPLQTTRLTRSPATEAVLAHLPMPRLDVSANFPGSTRSQQSMLASSSLQQHPIPTDAFFGRSLNPHTNASFHNNLTSTTYSNIPHTNSLHHHQQQPHSQPHSHSHPHSHNHSHSQPQPQLYSQTSHAPPCGPYDIPPTLPFDLAQFRPSPTQTTSPATSAHNLSQFDLSWPATEADGLAQMLADDHALDGDFWMSLPSHVQWQAWPGSGTGTTTSSNYNNSQMS